MQTSRRYAPLSLLLALVFTIGLTFASVELPALLDEYLQTLIPTPGGDSHASPAQVYRTELFIGHFHLRLIGYVCFALTILLIVVGFATRRSSLAALGALAFMLPVFAQFAGVMFFLAGLGILNLLWLPVLDISFELQHFGLVIRAPYDLTMWLFHKAGLNAYWPIVYLCIGGGLLVFFLGTSAWLTARGRNQDVADFWVYKLSRHPQYLGWILWTYGLFLLLLQARYPKRSWGIDASLPWLISTMVIIGVAMVEEMNMSRRYGTPYDEYRAQTPFFLPLPGFIRRALRWPFRFLFRKERPEHLWEVASTLSLATIVLIAASALFYGGGLQRLATMLQSDQSAHERMEAVYAELRECKNSRQRYFIAGRLAEFGDASLPYFIALLHEEDPDLRQNAAERLGKLHSQAAAPPLLQALQDPDRNVRHTVMRALQEIAPQEAEGPLLTLVTDPDPLTRRVAGRTLASLGTEEVVPYLFRELRDSLVWFQIGAAEDLGTLRVVSAVPVLTEQLSSKNPHLRRSVVVA
jgi:protein-S-isoprenylcysteine O-methyltransferase Ste14